MGDWVIGALEALQSVPLPLLLLLAWALAFSESGLGVGLVVPGETGVVVLSTTATDPARYAATLALVCVGCSMGDHVGYLLGRRFGGRLRHTRVVRRLGQDKWDRATEALHRYGAAAVFLTRLLPVVRTLTPAAAGVSRVSYPRFLPASLLGSFTWAGLYVTLGALAGSQAERIADILNSGGLALVAGGTVAVVVAWLVHRRRARRRRPEETAGAAPGPAAAEDGDRG